MQAASFCVKIEMEEEEVLPSDVKPQEPEREVLMVRLIVLTHMWKFPCRAPVGSPSESVCGCDMSQQGAQMLAGLC